MIGTKLAHYVITSHLGTGGMGEVYEASDTKLGRRVAIKILPEAFTHDAERSARFDREARVLASLNHPNIAAIHGIEESGGRKFLVMELVPGETLAERIKRGPIPLKEALRIAKAIAEGLEAAHEIGVIHRDLKPANIKVTDDGAVKVLDFGLAKISGTPVTASENSPTLSMTFTQAGVIFGTAAYMSPEQARGRPVDSRSDIWAFGVVLYEMLTTRRPFKGEDLTETLASVVKETPNLTAVPREVRRLIEACLQKDPKRRLQALGDRHLLMVEPEAQRTHWISPAIACVIALVAAALAWTHFREAPPLTQSLRYQLTRAGDTEFIQFQLSPDGRYLAFVAGEGGVNRLYVRAMDSLEDREFPGTEGTTYPFWSPDGAHIAFFSQNKLKQVAFGGGPATNIADAPDARGGTWGRDGTIVFAPTVVGTLSRVTVSRDGSSGPATPLKLPRAEAGLRDSLRFPAFLPDSDRFFYTIEADKREGEGIYVGSLNGDPPVRILPDFSTTRFVRSASSPTNGFILFRRGATLMAQPFNAANLSTTGEAFPLANSVPDSGNTSNTAFTVSANGTLIYLSDTSAMKEHEIVWLNRTGTRGKSILKQKGITEFALSPDRRQLVYSVASQRQQGDLWLHDVVAGSTQRFTFGPFSAFAPVWSPDSKAMVFTVYPEDRLYKKPALASAKEEALPVMGTNTYASSWSADGKFIVYSQTSAVSKNDIALLPLDGDRKPKDFLHTLFSETQGQISPNGLLMAYTSDSSLQREVYVSSVVSGGVQRQISVGGGGSPQWRSDGKELYFISDFKLMAVDVKPGPEPTFGPPHELFREPALLAADLNGFKYQPNSDGSQFLMLLSSGDTPAARPLTVVTNWQSVYGK